MVDLSNKEDVEKAALWKQDINNNTFVSTENEDNSPDDIQSKKRAENVFDKKIPIILMGNKFDKVTNRLKFIIISLFVACNLDYDHYNHLY